MWVKLGQFVAAIVLTFFGHITNQVKKAREEKARKKLQDDIELAEAIKNQDALTVGRIIKKNKEYKNLK